MENNKIPTAIEFLKEAQSNPAKGWTAHKAMQEFAKLHVAEALKEASKASFNDSKWDVENSYSLDNIK